jgi:hypothetical protein
VAGLTISRSGSAIVAGKTAFIAVMNGSIDQALFPCLDQLFAGPGIIGVAIQAGKASGRMQTVIENYRALPAAAVQQRPGMVGANRGGQTKQENRHGKVRSSPCQQSGHYKPHQARMV